MHVRRRFQRGGGAKLLQRQVIQQADAARAVVQLAGICPRVRDEAREIVRRQRRVHDEKVRRAADHGDRREVADRVVLQLAHGGIGAVRADVADHQRVAVRSGARHRHRGNRAARAGRVLDHERLLHGARKLVADRAADEVEAAARLRRHDDLHRLRRILSRRRRGCQRDDEGEYEPHACSGIRGQGRNYSCRNSINASSTASGASAISEWPE